MDRLNLLNDFKNAFEKEGIKLIVMYGTLIGLLRDQQIQSYDRGADFAINCNVDFYKIFPESNGKLNTNNKINVNIIKNLEQLGFTIKQGKFLNINQYHMKCFTNNKHFIAIDVFFLFKLDKNNYYEIFQLGNHYDSRFIDNPLKIEDFCDKWKHNFSFNIPNFPDKFLEGIYNNDISRQTSTKGNWMTPCLPSEILQNCSSSPHHIYMDKDLNIIARTWIEKEYDYVEYKIPDSIPKEYFNLIMEKK